MEFKRDLANRFVDFCVDYLGIKDKPNVIFSDSRKEAGIKTMANYNPANGDIKIYIKDRGFADIARSVAHEIAHHWQREEDRIKDHSEFGHIEDEANAKAGELIKRFAKISKEDIYESKFSFKETIELLSEEIGLNESDLEIDSSFSGDKVGIYINPSPIVMEEFLINDRKRNGKSSYLRGALLKSGDLYIADSDIEHYDFTKLGIKIASFAEVRFPNEVSLSNYDSKLVEKALIKNPGWDFK
jgi:hypothetical protein